MTQIFCPQCNWKPRPDDLWGCEPSCAHEWHTFDTRGQCPRCLKQWNSPQCLRCNQWSPHLDWYHEDATETARLKQLLDAETEVARPWKMVKVP